MYAEGILIDSRSKQWDGEDIIKLAREAGGDEQLIKIDSQLHFKDLSEATHPGDIFPSSIIIVREGVLDTIYAKIKAVLSGNDFPSRARFVVLKEKDGPGLIKQLKRDLDLNPAAPSNYLELKITVKAHLNDMDPVSDQGANNLNTFEKEVREITNGMYEDFVPEEYREEK